MDFEKLLKNHFVRLVLLAVLAYFAYHYFIGVKEGAMLSVCTTPAQCQGKKFKNQGSVDSGML